MASSEYDAHLKAQANLAEKLSILHPRAMAEKPSLSTIYVESTMPAYRDSPVYAWNIPHKLQLAFVFTHYNKIINANRTALKSSVQDSNVTRAIWYWGIDPAHSFFKDHEQIRYNLIFMTLVIMSADPDKHTTTAAQQFAWAFIMAWVEQLENEGNFTHRNHFIHIWKTGRYDLIVFTEAQKTRIKHAVQALKEEIGARDKEQAMNKVSSVVAEKFKAFSGAKWSLRWCFVHCGETMDLDHELGLDVDMEIDVDYGCLGRVNFGAPILQGLLVDIERFPILMEDEKSEYWLEIERAMEILEKEDGEAADALTQLFGGMNI